MHNNSIKGDGKKPPRLMLSVRRHNGLRVIARWGIGEQKQKTLDPSLPIVASLFGGTRGAKARKRSYRRFKRAREEVPCKR